MTAADVEVEVRLVSRLELAAESLEPLLWHAPGRAALLSWWHDRVAYQPIEPRPAGNAQRIPHPAILAGVAGEVLNVGQSATEPARSTPDKQGKRPRVRARDLLPRLSDRDRELVDFILLRLLVVAATIALLRGQATTGMAAVIWAAYRVLRNSRR